MSKRAHIRRRCDSDDEETNNNQPVVDDNNDSNSNDGTKAPPSIEDLKLLQKLRQRKNGLTTEELALGRQTNPLFPSKKSDSNDPYKLKSGGGLVEMNNFKQSTRSSKDMSTINDNFARETNTRDEDTEMQRYIEDQLSKIRQKSSADNLPGNDEFQDVSTKFKKPEDTLFHLNKFLITDHSAQASEEMLSDQMLSGIPEVDVGVEEKIRNIEETDKAKRKLLQTLCDKKVKEKKLPSTAATTVETPSKSASVSFVQHKRFNTDGMDILNAKKLKQNQMKDIVKPQPVVGNKEKHPTLLRDATLPTEPEKPLSETATDDLVFDQFRKNLHNSRNWKIRHA